MAQTLILAKSITEANAYAKAVGLPRFTYRAVRNAGHIRGVRHAEVHLLSSFTKRLDRHAILGALRWAKTLEVFYADFDFKSGEIRDGGEIAETPDGPTERELEVAYRYNALLDQEEPDDVSELEPVTTGDLPPEPDEEDDVTPTAPEQSEDAAPVAPRRRRSRCDKCGQLHFKDEPCPDPDPDEQRADTNGFAPPPANFFDA